MSELRTKSPEAGKNEVLTVLRNTQLQVLDAVNAIPAALHEQCTREGCWSVLQVLEHVVNSEEGMFRLWQKLAEAGTGDRAKDDLVGPALLDRSRKISAPERVVPQGRIKSVAEARERFIAARTVTIATVEQMPPQDLRNKIVPHPLIGTADGYQLFHIMAMHAARHADQIRETAQQLAATQADA
jgi:uncharacterized damage-inducible protein DinB